MKKYGLLVLLSAFYICAHAEPSFDCSKASTSVEKMICADSHLGNLDGLLATNYGALFGSTYGLDEEGSKQVKLSQKEWMKKRNACTTTECVASAYKSRIEEICEIPVVSGVNYCQSWDSLENHNSVSAKPSDGINDIISYNENSGVEKKLEPYSINEIIGLVQNSIDENGIYKGSWVDGFSDERMIAFDSQQFGGCEFFYIRFNGKTGGSAIDNLLRFSFPEKESEKLESSKRFKSRMEEIENPPASEVQSPGCSNWNEKSTKLKAVSNAILSAVPDIKRRNAEAIEYKNNQKVKAEKEKALQEEVKIAQNNKLETERKNKIAEDEKSRQEKSKKDKALFYLYAAIALVIGSIVWHKFIRRRCPKCNAVSPDLIKEVELESWLGTKKVSEKLANGKTKEKIVNTTFSKVESTYKCEECNHTWIEHTKREK